MDWTDSKEGQTKQTNDEFKKEFTGSLKKGNDSNNMVQRGREGDERKANGMEESGQSCGGYR